jgi:hypothetical protein
MQTYSVTQTARIFNVSAATIRRWCSEFSEHLSGMASPEPGETRVLTGDDVRVLAYVRDRLTLGASIRVVNQDLPTATLPALPDVLRDSMVSVADTTTSPGDTALATLTTAQLRLADSLAGLVVVGELRQAVIDLQRQIDTMQARIDALETLSHGHPAIVPRNRP